MNRYCLRIKLRIISSYILVSLLVPGCTSEDHEHGECQFSKDWYGEEDIGDGLYINGGGYDFSVIVPDGLIAFIREATFRDHGIAVRISGDSFIVIYADFPTYLDEDKPTLNQLLAKKMEGELERGSRKQSLSIDISDAMIGTLRAKQYIVRYTCEDEFEHFVDHNIVAIHSNDFCEIAYRASLYTTSDRYDMDLLVLMQIVQTFTLR